MSADTTPVILFTQGDDGLPQYRVAIAQAFELHMLKDDNGEEFLNTPYVLEVFGKSLVASSLEEAQRLLDKLVASFKEQHISMENEQKSLKLPGIGWTDLLDQAREWVRSNWRPTTV